MMGGGSGQEASVLEGLIAFGKDPKAMAGRLEQLKAAQDAAAERVAKAVEVEAANAKRTDDLASLASDLDRTKKTLDDLQERLNQTAADSDKRSAALDDREAALRTDKSELAKERQRLRGAVEDEAKGLAERAAALDAREKELGDKSLSLEEVDSLLTARAEKLDEREADFIARQEAVRQALAGVGV